MTNLRKVIINTLSNVKIVQAAPTNNEITLFDRSILLSETDLDGILVYTNRRYLGLTGFSDEELIGSSHKIIRHPDMPRGVFKAMWKIIQNKKIWRGYIKHLCKDGSYFWTLSYVQAKLDDDENVVGYISTGKIAYKETRKEVEDKYQTLMSEKDIDDKYFMASESYYETQILRKDYLSEYVLEAKGL
jgi:PAS domain S-box-containing protein